MGKYWVGFTYDMDLLGNSLLGFIMIFWGRLVVAWRRGGVFCKGINCTPTRRGLDRWSPSASRSHRRVTVGTPARRGPPFAPPKGGKSGSRGTDSPLTNPFLSLAVLDTNDAKHRPYCAQIRSQGACGAFYLDLAETELKINLISVV